MKTGNPIVEAIKSRKPIRQFGEDPVPDELLNQVLESGLIESKD